MRLVIFCPLFIAIFTLSSAFAATEDEAGVVEQDDSRMIAQQVDNYTRASRKRKPRIVTYKSIHSAKYKDYKVTEIPKYEIPPLLSREDLNKIVPSNVEKTDSSSDILRRMSDKAVNVWLKSSTMQQMSIVQTAQKVEQAMKAEVNLAPDDSEIKHKLNFQVQAFQTTSKIDYTGYVDATVSYNVRDHKAGYEVRKKVLHDKDLFMNHSQTKEEKLSTVGLKWSF